jgi:hypothetical protein
LLPEGHIYAPYAADPRRPNFALQYMYFTASDIPDSGRRRYGIKFGGQFELLQRHPAGAPDRGWQLAIEAGFIAQFDRDRSYDNIGWDGVYGAIVSVRPSDAFAFRFGLHHVSAHVGDEYAERTGRQRLNYTRGEYIAGARWSVHRRWQLYGELGRAYDLRNDEVQRRGRWQLGLEYAAPWRAGLEWYAGLDVFATEERGWQRDTTLQAGVALRDGPRTWRLGIEHYRGRALMGEFFRHDERHLALGLWLDL